MSAKRIRRIIVRVLIVLVIVLIIMGVNIYYAIGPSFACHFPSDGPVQSGVSTRWVTSGDRQRCYQLFVPSGYNTNQPVPVVFALHGFAGNGASFRDISVWEAVAEREKFVVVYPDGSAFPLRWNVSAIANIPSVDDVQFIQDMIAHLDRIASIDTTRVYVSGFSNGGQMTHDIACQLADQIAAVGIVDGFDASMLTPCSPARPVPLMAFFGRASPLQGIEYPQWFLTLINVSPEVNVPPLPDNALEVWLEGWAKRNGCTSGALRVPSVGNTSATRYEQCPEDAEVILYSIEGQGHAWPGGPSLPMLGESIADINASEALWAFFKRYATPAGRQ